MKKRLSPLSRMNLVLMRTMARMMPSCKDVSILVSRSLDEQLSFRLRVGVRLHLAFCKWCRRYRHQLQLIHTAMDWDETCDFDHPDDTATLSPDARSRITKALDGDF